MGQKIPTTTDEFYNILKLLKENDMNGNGNRNDEIPFSFQQGGSQFSLKSMFGSFGVLDNAEHLQVMNGTVVFTPSRPEFREALEYFNKLYSEGLMDDEGFSQSEQQYVAKARETPAVYGSFMANIISNVVDNDKVDNYTPIAPLKGPAGIRLWNRERISPVAVTGMAITKKCKSPETLIRLYDYVNSSYDSIMLWYLGPENVAWERDSLGRWVALYNNIPQGSTWEELWYTVGVGSNGMQFAGLINLNDPNVRSVEGDANLLNKLRMMALQEPFFPAEFLPLGLEDQDVVRERSILYADINTYVRNFIPNAVKYGLTDTQWNEHLRNIERLNIPRYVQPYQELYDRSR